MTGRIAHLVALLMIVATSAPEIAFATDRNDWRLGLVAGQVSLLGEVSDDDPNGVGLGVAGGFFIEDNLALDVQYLSSTHSNVNHHDFSIGAQYYIGDYMVAYPSLIGGVSFLSNKIKSVEINGAPVTLDKTSDGFGFFAGGGFDFEISEFLTAGMQLRYQAAFQGRTRVNNVDFTTVDDSVTILLRFLYRFEGDAE